MTDTAPIPDPNSPPGAQAPPEGRPTPSANLDAVAAPPVSDLSQEDLDLLTRAAAEADSDSAGAESPSPRSTISNGFIAGDPSIGPGFDLPEFAAVAAPIVTDERISMLSDVNLNVKIELGRTRMLIEDVLKLDAGSVVELDKLAGDPVDVFANDRLIARGEVLVLNESFCVRINEVFAGDPHRVV